MNFDEFSVIPFPSQPDEALAQRIKENLDWRPNDAIVTFEENKTLERWQTKWQRKYIDWYSLCLWTNGLKPVSMNAPIPQWVTFNKHTQIDEWFVQQHHDFYKRWGETLQQTVWRMQHFFETWWVMFSAEHCWSLIGTMGIYEKEWFLVLFSYFVLPEWRNKWAGKALLKNVLDDITSKGYETCFFKTKNKFVYYFLTRYLDAKILWKEIYIASWEHNSWWE